MLVCGCEEADWPEVARAGETSGAVICAFGVHPWHVDNISGDWELTLEKYLVSNPASAVGEIGLDNAVAPRNDDLQAAIFIRQLRIAERLCRPVSIHCRKAWGSLIPILKETGGLRHGGAVHSYSGPPDLIGELEKLGCYISFSGSILNDRSKRAVESLKRVSPNRLLIETDNDPVSLYIIRNRVADILNVSANEISALTYDNGIRLFAGAVSPFKKPIDFVCAKAAQTPARAPAD